MAMLIMAAGAVYMGLMKNQISNVFGGFLTLYLVTTAWMTARRGDGETSMFDWVALSVGLAAGVSILTYALKVANSPTGARDGVPVGMSFFLASVALLATAGDLRMLLRGGVSGTQRIARHLWRMCFALFIAAGSFLLGPANRPRRLLSEVGIGQYLPSALFSIKLYFFLTLLPLLLMIFWLVRVRFANGYKRKSTPATGAAYSVRI